MSEICFQQQVPDSGVLCERFTSVIISFSALNLSELSQITCVCVRGATAIPPLLSEMLKNVTHLHPKKTLIILSLRN